MQSSPRGALALSISDHMKIAVDKQPDQITPKATRIIFLLDRSSSMERMKEEAVSGYNQYLTNQQKVEGEASISLIFFDSSAQTVYENAPVVCAKPIVLGSDYRGALHYMNPLRGIKEQMYNPLEYTPQGMTSLFDTIHATIMRFKDTTKPDVKTIFAILTDGEDTSSRSHSYNSVQAAIKEVQDGMGWEVLFLGANMDASRFARNIGIKQSNVTQFDYTSKGVSDAINTMSFASSYHRGDLKARSVANATGAALATGDLDLKAAYAAVASGKATDVDEEMDKDADK